MLRRTPLWTAGLAMLLSLAARAQADKPLPQISTPREPAEREQVLVGGPVEHGGYGGPRLSFGGVAGHDALQVGGEGGWIINHSFIIGGAGYGLVTDQPAPGQFASTENLTVGAGGLMLGYTVLPQRLVHATITTMIGAGGLGRRVHNGGNTDLGDAFFVLEPTATVELNIAHFMRGGLALSYRWVTGVQTEGISNADLRGVFGSMILKFGKF